MPIRQFRKAQRILTTEQQLTLHEQAVLAAERIRLSEAEKERLVAEEKMRKIILHPDPRTTIIRYERIE